MLPKSHENEIGSMYSKFLLSHYRPFHLATNIINQIVYFSSVKSDIVQVSQLEQLRIQEETKKQYTPGQTISVGRLLSNSQEVGQLPSSALNGKSRLIVS